MIVTWPLRDGVCLPQASLSFLTVIYLPFCSTPEVMRHYFVLRSCRISSRRKDLLLSLIRKALLICRLSHSWRNLNVELGRPKAIVGVEHVHGIGPGESRRSGGKSTCFSSSFQVRFGRQCQQRLSTKANNGQSGLNDLTMGEHIDDTHLRRFAVESGLSRLITACWLAIYALVVDCGKRFAKQTRCLTSPSYPECHPCLETLVGAMEIICQCSQLPPSM